MRAVADEGNALPERTVELLERYKLGLFGAITSKPKPQAAAEIRPGLREPEEKISAPPGWQSRLQCATIPHLRNPREYP